MKTCLLFRPHLEHNFEIGVEAISVMINSCGEE
jgi:hypothetical protein